MQTAPLILPRIAAGDESAVTDCVDRYGGLVWRLARRYLDGAPGDVEDAAQEVFIEIWLRAERFDPARGAESAFVATIAHRRLIDYQRRTSARLRRVTIEAKPESPERLEAGPDVDDVTTLASAFDRLPDEERRALWLSIHAGMSHRQIGDVMGSPIGTVKTRLRRALMRLHESLNGDHTIRQGGGA